MKALAIYYTNQCDKKKCTGVKIYQKKHQFNFPVYWLTSKNKIHQRSIVLTPFGDLLRPVDKKIIEKYGLTVLDCSWKQKDPILHHYFKNARKLPKLLAGNPVNYGKWDFLTSAEAVIATLFITGYSEEANQIIKILSWGNTFFNLNKELLEAYREIEDDKSYEKVYSDFFSS